MTYDCRTPDRGRDPHALSFPCPVVVRDAAGTRIPNVFWLCTSGVLRRFVVDANGDPMVGPDGKGRLEVTEHRPWVATAVKDGTVIARSSD